MKKIILSLLLVGLSIMASAHVLTPTSFCSITSRVTINNTQFTIGNNGYSAYFFITQNGTSDTLSDPIVWRLRVDLTAFTTIPLNDSVGAITSTGFNISVPQITNTLGTGVTVFISENDGTPTNIYNTSPYLYTSLIDVCGDPLAVAFASITQTRINTNQVQITFQPGITSGVKVYNIQLSFDNGKTWVMRQSIIPDGTLPNKTYTAILNVKK